jgi:hypothetical protein
MAGPRSLAVRAPFILAAALLLSAAALSAAPRAFSFRVILDPESPEAGQPLLVDVLVEGMTGASLGTVQLGPGLSFESSLVKPWHPASGPGGTEVVLGLRVQGAGTRSIDRLEISGAEGNLEAGPLRFEARSAGVLAAPAWTWRAPDRVYRYSTFHVSLAGPADAAGGSQAVFAVPTGATFEVVPGESLSWIVTALDGGIVLPEAGIEGSKTTGRVSSRTIEVLPLPSAIEGSRAQGDLSLRFEGPSAATARAGDILTFRLAVAGRGNLPSVRFPAIVASLDGRALAPESWTESRGDSIQPSSDGYEGSAVLEMTLEAPGPGTLVVRPGPFPVLLPNGSVAVRTAAGITIRVQPSASPAGGAPADPWADLVPVLASRLAQRDASLERLPAIVTDGKPAAALETLGKAPLSVRLSTDCRLLEAGLLWKAGSRGSALAELYGLLRTRPGDTRAAKTAAALQKQIGTGPACRDALPEPRAFLWPGLCAIAATGAFLIPALVLRKKRPGKRRWRPALGAAAGLLGLAGAVLLALALVSGLERHDRYAVVWTDRIFTVPSPLAEGSEEVVRGSSALVIGRTQGYIGLRFADGSMGWAREESVYLY